MLSMGRIYKPEKRWNIFLFSLTNDRISIKVPNASHIYICRERMVQFATDNCEHGKRALFLSRIQPKQQQNILCIAYVNDIQRFLKTTSTTTTIEVQFSHEFSKITLQQTQQKRWALFNYSIVPFKVWILCFSSLSGSIQHWTEFHSVLCSWACVCVYVRLLWVQKSRIKIRRKHRSKMAI